MGGSWSLSGGDQPLTVFMRVARGSASFFSSHGRGIGPTTGGSSLSWGLHVTARAVSMWPKQAG